jgi:hypothetical protein
VKLLFYWNINPKRFLKTEKPRVSEKEQSKKEHAKIKTDFFNTTENHKKAVLFEGITSF